MFFVITFKIMKGTMSNLDSSKSYYESDTGSDIIIPTKKLMIAVKIN